MSLFWKKGPDCVLLWVKLSIPNVVGRSHSKIFAFIYFNESPLKIMKNIFYFMLKALFVHKILIMTFVLTFWIDKKGMVNLKVYDVTDWTINSSNTHIVQYLKK